MIATIDVITAIAEKKKFSDRSRRGDIKSSISVTVVAAIAGKWFP